jgi:hypothetical protein
LLVLFCGDLCLVNSQAQTYQPAPRGGLFHARYHLDMPRFSIKDLMLATALVAAGMCITIFANDIANTSNSPSIVLVLTILGLFLGGFALVGAGVLYPFGRAWTGALVGFFLSALWLGFMIVI